MNKEELVNKLEELDYPHVETTCHKSRLKKALLASGVFKRPQIGSFFRIGLRGVELSLSRRVLIPAGIAVLVILAAISGLGLAHKIPGRSSVEEQLSLAIISPRNNTSVNDNVLSVQGKTDPGAVVSINNELTIADEQGVFSYDLNLNEGINVINVTVSNDSGQQASTTLVVNSEGGA